MPSTGPSAPSTAARSRATWPRIRRVVASAIDDRAGAEVAPAEQARARRACWAFSPASLYEWMFWDAAWQEETWPLTLTGAAPATIAA